MMHGQKNMEFILITFFSCSFWRHEFWT